MSSLFSGWSWSRCPETAVFNKFMQLLTKEQPCQVGVQTRLSQKLRLGCAYKHTHLWTLRLLYNFLYSLTHWNLSILKMQSVAFSLLHSDCVCVVSEGLLKLASSSVTIRKPSLKGNISKSLLGLPPMPPPSPSRVHVLVVPGIP